MRNLATAASALFTGVVALSGAGCGGESGQPGDVSDRAVATFEVANGEQFKVELATAELVDHARRLLDGEGISQIPIGTVRRDDPGVNAPWSWHLDPGSFSFAFATIEVCDGIPSDVENQNITSNEYCPWSANIVAIEPPP